ncbi:MAG: Rab family GTPase [Promethearchaeota archaeon]
MNDLVVKVCVAGEGGTGKTSLINRLIHNTFSEFMKMTIGTGIYSYDIVHDDHKVVFQIWDFAGEDRFRFFLPTYLKGSSAVLLCWDMSRFITLRNLNEWYEIVEKNAEDAIIYMIGTKKDIKGQDSTIDEGFIESFKKNKKFARIFETSAKTGENIKELFSTLAKDILEKRKLI